MADPRILDTISKLLKLGGQSITQGVIPAQQFNIGLEQQDIGRQQRAQESELSRQDRLAREAESLRRYRETKDYRQEGRDIQLEHLGLSKAAGARAQTKADAPPKPTKGTDPLITESRELTVAGKKTSKKEKTFLRGVSQSDIRQMLKNIGIDPPPENEFVSIPEKDLIQVIMNQPEFIKEDIPETGGIFSDPKQRDVANQFFQRAQEFRGISGQGGVSEIDAEIEALEKELGIK